MPKLKNCLIKENAAWGGGGGISVQWSAAPTISNCTIVENEAFDPNNSNHGYGGGLLCTQQSQTILLDSILWNNNGQFGDQIAIGNQDDPRFMQRPAGLTVRYSDIQGGQQGIHIEQGRTLNWLQGNLSDDPLFVASYYLSQTAAGQSQTSPAVDAGSDSANQLGLSTYTTRTDYVGDAGKVDMGFHYVGTGRYQLSVSVIGGHGTVTPVSGQYHEFQVVTLVATPDAGYRVKRWIGTDRDPSWNRNTNTVTMDTGASKMASVEFERSITQNLFVPQDFATIEDAITAAGPGGTNIIISQGTHPVISPNGIDFQGKAIVLMSTDPNDPEVVARTVIDVAADKFNPGRAVPFPQWRRLRQRDRGLDHPQRLRPRAFGRGWPIRRAHAGALRSRGPRPLGSAATPRRTRT